MLVEYALNPDIFDPTCYNSLDLCTLSLLQLKDPLLEVALARDLRNGDWNKFINREISRFHPKAKELLRKLIDHHRLRLSVPILQNIPETYGEWCHEAVASHNASPLTGIIAGEEVATSNRNNPVIHSIQKLPSAAWWQQSLSPSVTLRRSTADYLKHLRLLLDHARSVMFIDPHLDPSRQGYREFLDLLSPLTARAVRPLIEIHRVCYKGSGQQRIILDQSELEIIFRNELEPGLRSMNQPAVVFVWDDFHDRYIISELIGISIPNGFDIAGNLNDLTRWTRLSRTDRDSVQREFDPASKGHTLRYKFTLAGT